MIKAWVFDMPHTIQITTAKIGFLNRFLASLIKSLGLRTALDVGCAVGYFSRYLKDLGLEVVGLDGRPENVKEAQRRHPDIKFMVYNLEDPAIRKIGSFDLVLCFGLLYHLENTFITIRNLHALTAKVLFIESTCIPEYQPFLYLHDEVHMEDQGLQFVAFCPSEGCLIKMCYRAGFPFVYRFTDLPDHSDFRATIFRKKVRTILAASKVALNFPFLAIALEPAEVSNLWATFWAKAFNPLFRLSLFIRKPWSQKIQTVRFKMRRFWNFIFPYVPIPIRLPFGVWWLAYNDVCNDEIFAGNFEKAGYQFVECFLQPGMTTVDIGAHHGFYTLLAAKKIGPQGRVIAFEPSSRERKRLLWHLRLNNCKNVWVNDVALGNFEGEAEFFLVKGRSTGSNSLRPPRVSEPVKVVCVPVATLDSRLGRYKIDGVDFIKMDVEGAELEVLKGAKELLQRHPRPVIYCEVQDLRTQAWDYKAKEIIKFLITYRYYWFEPSLEGKLRPISIDQEYFDGNFVAVPEERIEQIAKLLENTD